jgi:ADP-heptose:LPS heptosyltransferase
LHRDGDRAPRSEIAAIGCAGDTVRRVDIAVVVNGGVTETLQSTPLLRTLRAGFPTARISLLCPSSAADLADGIPPVDRVIPLTQLRGRRSGGVHLWLTLRGLRLDAVFLCTSGVLPAASAYFAGVSQRSGVGGSARGLLLTGRVRPGKSENRAQTWLRLAQVAGVHQELHSPVFEPGPDARRRAEQVLHGTGLADGRLLVAIAPGSGYAEGHAAPVAATSWDPERWAHLANQLAQRHGAGILLVGSPQDRYAAERTKMDLRADAIDLVGEIDLPTLAGVLARCDLLICTDTPLLQLAAAMGTPTVGLFGPTDGTRGGAYGRAHRVVQAQTPPHYENSRQGEATMDQIRVEDVLAGIEATL